MSKTSKKFFYFILLSALIIVIALSIPVFRRDYYSPTQIEHSQCTAYCNWINNSLFFYSDDYKSKNKNKLDIIDNETINILKEKKYADISKYTAKGFKTTYPAQPGQKCVYIMSEDETAYCRYHGKDKYSPSEEYKKDLEFSKITDKLTANYAFPIIIVIGIIIWCI